MQYVETVGYKLNTRLKASVDEIFYYPFHLHKDTVEIILVLRGNVVVSDSATNCTLHSGQIYIFNANDLHRISSDESNMILTIQLERSYFRRFFSRLEYAYFICDGGSRTHDLSVEERYLHFLLSKCYFLYTQKTPPEFAIEECGKELIQLLLTQFQNYVYRHSETGEIQIERRNLSSLPRQGLERMYRIVDYVMVHFRERISLSQIASMEYLSESYLSRYLKETLGLTFSELISLTRCEEAERLLFQSSKTIDQIALDVGFCNRKHLATQFQRWFSKTPSSFRKSVLLDISSENVIRKQKCKPELALEYIQIYLD